MASIARIARWSGVIALILAALALGASLLVPRILDSRKMLDLISREVSSRAAGTFSLQGVRLELFPLPRLTAVEAAYAQKDRLSLRARTLNFYPRLLPLLLGRVEIDRVRIQEPSAVLARSEKAGAEALPVLPPPPEAMADAVESAVAAFQKEAPGISVVIEKGALTLPAADGAAYRFEDIEAVLSASGPKLELTCRSNLWTRLRLKWTYDAARPPGKIRFDIVELQPAPLVQGLLPASGFSLSGLRVNLSGDVLFPERGRAAADFTGDLPVAALARDGRRLDIRGASFAGSIRFEPAKIFVDLGQWKSDSPALQAAVGLRLGVAPDGGFRPEQVTVRADAVDVAAVGKGVLLIAGKDPVLSTVFDVVRSGRVSDFFLQCRIPGRGETFSPDDLVLDGRIQNGRVHVPEIGMDIAAAAGRARIRGGLLTAESVKAVYGPASGSGGVLELGLFDGSNRFFLDIDVESGLTGLPELLARLIDDPAFTREVSRIESIEGSAEGRLVLGDAFGDIRPKVTVRRLSAGAVVDFLPRKVTVSGTGIEYRGEALSAEALDLSVGGASVTGLSGALTWAESAWIAAEAEYAAFQVDPVMAWLPQTAAFAGLLPKVALSGGELRLSSLRWRGPAFSPAKWDFTAEGAVESVKIGSEALPAPVTVSHMGFRAGPTLFQSTDFQIGFLDAVLSGSGSLEGTPSQVQSAALNLEGKIGPQADRWFLSRSQIPPALTLRLHQVADARVRWERGGLLEVSGDLLLNADTRLSVDLQTGPHQFDLKRLAIEDRHSKAEISIRRLPEAVEFSYTGRLTRETVDRLVRSNDFLGGRIMGGMRGRIDLASPSDSRMEGRMEIEQLRLPFETGLDIRIENASLYGEKDRLDVERFDVFVDDAPYKITGEAIGRQGGFDVKASVDAERLDLALLKAAFSRSDQSGQGTKPAGKRISVTGKVAVAAETAIYDGYRLEGVDATVSLLADRTEVSIHEGTFCGISVPARIEVLSDSVSLEVQPSVAGGQLDQAARCLFDDDGQMEGRFSLHGNIAASRPPADLTASLSGVLKFSAAEGLIRESAGFGVLKRVLALINITEIFAGSLPDFSRTGFRYNSIQARSDIENGVLHLTELVIDGRNLKLTAEGDVDLKDHRLNLVVLAAPLKTVDRIVGKIPLVSDILEGTLISIPIRVKGTLEKPEADFIPASAVGKGLIGITERTLELPFKIIRPDRP